ncbi:MAG: hypothetical protein HC927_07410 [Deltaproteobacteria bacterium]|nr:hypothetical protein [Deltaproteobacteria bacterium]
MRIERYVEQVAPSYRHILQLRPEAIEQLPADLTDDRLDTELHKISYDIERDHRERTSHILRGPDIDREEYVRLVSEENELGKSALAKYVAHRRWILNMFERAINAQPGPSKPTYALEEAVHQLIFPLQTTSDEIRYHDQNLWLIDERLTYHYYLASDKAHSTMARFASDDDSRPDILIFDRSHALAEGDDSISSVVIIEFKRPMRTRYNDADDNPITQVLGYVRTIRSGSAKDRNGRPIRWRPGMPFYCHIVADLTSKLKIMCENVSYTPTPDGEGYYGYNATLGAYVEVSSYTKILSDAMKRNRIFLTSFSLHPLSERPSRPQRSLATIRKALTYRCIDNDGTGTFTPAPGP